MTLDARFAAILSGTVKLAPTIAPTMPRDRRPVFAPDAQATPRAVRYSPDSLPELECHDAPMLHDNADTNALSFNYTD